ncbi:hypothetical protein MAPG_10204 [Magnaporthiopsis poae ATCC 64411]|uniref:Uncharacterized protein n=1 Tax=Magnaporthiopsis poae (strain ATCC 64411 / 73-15) TaxID=644358 RepID=A0A0C4EBZ2_MAGP6|nr:hypothetical protein MAPG_10204 [Magnaporthiopsis poae ATCC 64411]
MCHPASQRGLKSLPVVSTLNQPSHTVTYPRKAQQQHHHHHHRRAAPKGTTTSIWLIQGGPLTSLPPTLTASVGGSSIARTYAVGQPTARPASEGWRVDWWDRVSVTDVALTKVSDVLYEVRKSGRLADGGRGEELGKVDLSLEARCSLDTTGSTAACSGSWSSTMSSRDGSAVTTSATRGTSTTIDSVKITQVPIVIAEGTTYHHYQQHHSSSTGAGVPCVTQNAALAGGAAILAGGALLLA